MTRALQAYLGHKNIQHTVRYAELSPESHSIRINTTILTPPMLKNVISCSLVVINDPLVLSCPWSGGAGRYLGL